MKQKPVLMDTIFDYITIALAALMPLFFLPLTSEFFEFNKLTLLASATIVMMVLWVVKLLVTKKVFTVKSVLNGPIMALGIVYILSAIFSINQVESIFGKYGRWFPSLFAFVVMIAFYYVVAINVHKKKVLTWAINGFIGAISFNSLVAIISYFGVNLFGSSFSDSPNFNLLGSVTSTAMFAALVAVFALYRLVKTEQSQMKIAWLNAIVVNVILLVLYNIGTGWITLVLAMALGFMFFDLKKFAENTLYFAIIAGITFALALVSFLPQTASKIRNEEFSKELVLSIPDSWVVVSNTLTTRPVLGTGPSTFQTNYTLFKPRTVNARDYWNIRFDKPYNELFSSLSGLGIVGTLAMAYFAFRVVTFALYSKKYEDETGETHMLAVGLIVVMASYLLTYATVFNTFVVMLFLGLLTGVLALNASKGDGYVEHVQISLASLSTLAIINGLTDDGPRKKREIFQYLAVIPLLIIAIAMGMYMSQMYMGEYYLRRSIIAARENKGAETYDYQRKAINVFPRRSEYRNTYAQTNLLLASNLAQSEDLDDNDRNTIRTLIAQAIREVRLSTELVNPDSAGSWEVRAGVYRSLIGVAQNSERWAINAYENAMRRDPLNPRLKLATGGIYYVAGDYLNAANYFRQATQLKPDYANAHYNLSQALKQLNNYPLALAELQVVQRLVPADSEDYARVQEEIDELAELTRGQAQPNPSIETLDQQAQIEEQGQPTDQEPLSQPGALDTIDGVDNLNLNQEGQQQAQPEGSTQQQNDQGEATNN